MAYVTFIRNFDEPPSAQVQAEIAALKPDHELTEADLDAIEADAEADPDNPPSTDEELARGVAGRSVRWAREATGLDHAAFAQAYGLDLDSLMDWERGRHHPGEAVLSYMRAIHADPAVVRELLARPTPAPVRVAQR